MHPLYAMFVCVMSCVAALGGATTLLLVYCAVGITDNTNEKEYHHEPNR